MEVTINQVCPIVFDDFYYTDLGQTFLNDKLMTLNCLILKSLNKVDDNFPPLLLIHEVKQSNLLRHLEKFGVE